MDEFNKEDVIKVAKAIIENPLGWMDGDFLPYFFCKFCDSKLTGYTTDIKYFKHKLDCPVLVAQDLLTNIPE